MTHPSSPAPPGQGASGEVLLVRQGNMLYVTDGGINPPPKDVLRLLHPRLSYEHREFLYGWRARDPVTGQKRRVEITEQRMYRLDRRGRLETGWGFLRRVTKALTEAGYTVRLADLNVSLEASEGHPRPDRYRLDLGNVTYHFRFRERQAEALAAIAANPCGTVHAVTGFGKMALIVMTCLLFPQARVHVVTRRIPLVNKLVDYLTRYLPDVGMFGDGSRRFGQRVTVFSAGSLHHTDYDADLLLCDEGHELAADRASSLLAGYQRSRNYTFTATPYGRGDGADLRLEALFGPSIFYLPYWEAVALGLVAPIRVEWTDVALDFNPAAGYEDVERRRRGIWFNDRRNDLIAGDVASAVPADEQFLVLTDTVYHAVEIYRRLAAQGRPRRTVLVYDKVDARRFKQYQHAGHLPSDLTPMTPEIKERYRLEFEAGRVDAVATSTWDTGIDPVQLQHLFIGSSFSSEIKAQQAPGRASRINPSGGKQVGRVHDYRDQFDQGFHAAARERARVYHSLRWEQVVSAGGGVYTPLPGFTL